MSTKRPGFKMPESRSATVDSWVEGAKTQDPAPPLARPKAAPVGKIARLTIDLPPDLHARFKAACAIHRTKMVDEVTKFIEEWTQKHS